MDVNFGTEPEPVAMAQHYINVPPAQDSPHNIVNILNDDCIQKILLELNNFRDFWSASQVCKRFEENAKLCFPFRKIIFSTGNFLKGGVQYIFTSRKDNQPVLILDLAKIVLSKFGSRVRSIECVINPAINRESSYQLLFDSISYYCGRTLVELQINYTTPKEFYILNLQSPFFALKNLKLIHTSFLNFNVAFMLPQLECLELIVKSAEPVEWFENQWFGIQFPKLKHVEFILNKCNYNLLVEFQRRHPQVQRLKVYGCENTTVWENIGTRMPNIVHLALDHECIGSNIIHISELRHLRKLHIQSRYIYFYKMDIYVSSIKLLFASFIANGQPIEGLQISHVDVELSRMIKQLRTINSLHISKTPSNLVIDIVKNLPNLEYVYFDCYETYNRQGTGASVAATLLRLCPAKLAQIDTEDIVHCKDVYAALSALWRMENSRVKLNFIYNKRRIERLDSDALHSFRYLYEKCSVGTQVQFIIDDSLE